MPEDLNFFRWISISQMPHHFQIMDGKLLPALNTIDGLGDKAADAIAEAAKDGIFLSKDDFRERTKVIKDSHRTDGVIWDCLAICRNPISFPCLILARNVMEVLKNKRGGTAFLGSSSFTVL